MMKGIATGAALIASSQVSASEIATDRLGTGEPVARKGRIKQSVSRWCYPKSTIPELAAFGASIGLKGVDLLQPDEFDIPARYGLTCTMGYADGGTIQQGLNRLSNHDGIEQGFRKYIPLAAKAKVPNVITFSGVRAGMSDDEGLKNSIIGLNRVKKIAEDNGVIICMELLNSKIDHHDYMADHTAWGVKLMEAVASPNVKLLYDIYHMQIQEGDLIRTIDVNIQWMGHFHTGGVPGRHELNNDQEVNWVGVMRAIAGGPFKGYVAHEFVPAAADPLVSLRQAVDLCDV
jgi:hydroxypyruvate isomerase